MIGYKIVRWGATDRALTIRVALSPLNMVQTFLWKVFDYKWYYENGEVKVETEEAQKLLSQIVHEHSTLKLLAHSYYGIPFIGHMVYDESCEVRTF